MSVDAVARAIKSATAGKMQSLTVAVGQVTVTAASGLTAASASVRGITETPIVVGRESWCEPFASSVSAGSVDGRLVVLLFNDGQPMILCLIGV